VIVTIEIAATVTGCVPDNVVGLIKSMIANVHAAIGHVRQAA